ncbi:MAG: ABC transporter ATP-binding protein [Oscillospiraceae bacterium]
MAKPLIVIKDLRKVYRIGTERVVALNRMSLEIYEGEICCLLGTSGSGKSTLLNMMAGLEKPTSGNIVIDKKTVTSLTEKELAVFRQGKIGFVFQSYNLLPSMTALENVAMPLLFLGDSKKNRNTKAKSILKAVGLEKHMYHRPTQMSGGQQQRVGIARAFVNMPKIVFADEPTGNLDSKTTVEVMAIIINLAKTHNQTLIIVTHDPSISKYADRIVHILDGDIASVELNENPIVPDPPELKDHVAGVEKTKKSVKSTKPLKATKLEKAVKAKELKELKKATKLAKVKK